jgi:branched-chain amino acid transport system substrate-binding protein
MEEAGNKPQFVDNFRPAQSSQVGLIRRLKRSGVEAVYLAANGDDVALIGRNMIKFGPGLEIATGDSVSLLPFIEDNKGIPVGLLTIMPAPPEEFAAVQKLIKAIEAEKLEPEPYLLMGYSTMQVVIKYLGEADRTFSNKNFPTILGNVNFNSAGKNTTKQYKLYRWNGKTFTWLDLSQ